MSKKITPRHITNCSKSVPSNTKQKDYVAPLAPCVIQNKNNSNPKKVNNFILDLMLEKKYIGKVNKK